jgi:IMP dehydrogenase
MLQAVRQGFQDLGARDIPAVRERVASGTTRLEVRSGAAQAEGGVHNLHAFEKTRW